MPVGRNKEAQCHSILSMPVLLGFSSGPVCTSPLGPFCCLQIPPKHQKCNHYVDRSFATCLYYIYILYICILVYQDQWLLSPSWYCATDSALLLWSPKTCAHPTDSISKNFTPLLKVLGYLPKIVNFPSIIFFQCVTWKQFCTLRAPETLKSK